jgi:hypothetical protein
LPSKQSGKLGSLRFVRKRTPFWPWADYCGDWLAGLFGKNGGALWYALRRSRKAASEGEAALRAWHRGLRARIESVFASLEDQFQIEKTRARSVWGVMTRVVAKLLAYMVGFVINEALGRPGTALKSLYR